MPAFFVPHYRKLFIFMAFDAQFSGAILRQQRFMLGQVNLMTTSATHRSSIPRIHHSRPQGMRHAMLVLVAGAAEADGIRLHKAGFGGSVRGVARRAADLVVWRVPVIGSQIGRLRVTPKAQRTLLSSKKIRLSGRMSIVAGRAFKLIERQMLMCLNGLILDTGVTTQTQIVYGSFQRVSPGCFRVRMAGLTTILGKGRVLQRHEQAARFGSMRIMAGCAIGAFKIAAPVYRYKLRIGLMAFGAKRVIILAHQPGVISPMSFVAGHAFARSHR